MQIRKCHPDPDTNANRIGTKNNIIMSTLISGGGINIFPNGGCSWECNLDKGLRYELIYPK